jgi:hypothetical protein
MTTPRAAPGADAVQAALDSGDIAGARRALLSLNDREVELLRKEVGDEAVELLRAASRISARLGKVIRCQRSAGRSRRSRSFRMWTGSGFTICGDRRS